MTRSMNQSKKKEIKAAVVNMPTVFADINANMRIAENYIQYASDNHAELIVFPEFFTTGFAVDSSLISAILSSRQIEHQLAELSKTYHIAIGGSYLHYNRKTNNAYNTFGLFFPTGESYYHSKDIPTGLENFCYTQGDTISAFDTPLGRIGIVMCWEQLRYDSARRMAGKIYFLIGGSCWWGITPEDGKRTYLALAKVNQKLAQKAPLKFARLLHVPYVHANHCASFEGASIQSKDIRCIRPIESRAMVVDAKGQCQYIDHHSPECHLHTITPGCSKTKFHLSKKKYWILHMPFFMKKGFHMLNEAYTKYYENVTRRQFTQQ